MTDISYPVYKSCDFLAVNFYEEISSAFEESVCDALIEENTFLLKERHNDFPCLDDFYRRPWKRVQCDKEFILSEANVKESIAEICQDAQFVTNDHKWYLFNEDCSDDFKAPVVEENLCIGKDLNILREKALHGEYQLLDEPPIPFNLLQHWQKSSFISLLKKLPMMEIEELFDSNKEISFGDENLFFEAAEIEDIKRISSYDIEVPDEEISLPEIQLDEISYLESGVVRNQCFEETNFSKVIQNAEQGEKLEKKVTWCTDGFVSKQSERSSNPCSYDLSKVATIDIDMCGGNSAIKSNSVQSNYLLQSLYLNTKQIDVDPKQSRETEDLSNHLEIALRNNFSNEFKCDEFKESKHLPDLENFNSLTTYDSVLDNSMNFAEHNKNTNYDIDNDIQQISSYHPDTCVSQNFEENEYTEYTISNECIDSNKGSVLGNTSHFPSEHFSNSDKCFYDITLGEEDNKNCEESNDSLQTNKEHSLLKKLLNLQYNENLPVNKCLKNLPYDHSDKSSKNINSYTAVRKRDTPGLVSSNLDKDKVIRNKLESPFISKLLQVSTFMNVRKLDCESSVASSSQLTSSSNYENIFHNADSKPGQDGYEFLQKKECLFLSQSSIPAESFHTAPELKVEDILVNFPDAFVDVVLMYEAAAIPILQSLIHFDKFNFPLNFSLANIPSYKTCFLLNQEAKLCQDKETNLLKNGNKEVYYIQLLSLHGILKSMENFIEFDPHLAISTLCEFQKSHESLIKGQYSNLIRKLRNIINNLCESYSVHPKVKDLCIFIREKYIFCKENELEFKVMIILRKYLNMFYIMFETECRKDLFDLTITMIPENIVLHPTTQMFKNTEDIIYVVNSSSLSKNIPWKSLKLVIEFEHDHKSCWKQICSEQNIPHAFVKIIDLPFKSLEEIQGLESKENNGVILPQKNERSLIISSHIASQYQLLYLLESKLNFSLHIRQYKELLPHIHFADIVVDERSALLLVSDVAFFNEDLSEMSDRVSFLHLKYEACWIIIQENQRHDKSGTVKKQKSRDTCQNFFSKAIDFSMKVENYKLKILYAQSIEETVDLIKYVSSVSSRRNALIDATTKISISNQVSKEEIFLASFPCLNPYVVHLILSEYSLYEFLNTTVEECCKILYSVPKRFLKCFYSTVQRTVTSALPNKYEDLFKSFDNSAIEASDSNEYEQSFQLKPSFVEDLDALHRYDKFEMEQQKCQDLFDRKNHHELNDIDAQYSGQGTALSQMEHPELSLQEIDLDYMSLKLTDKYECSHSSDEPVYKTDSMSSHSSNSFTLATKEELKERSDSQCMFQELSHPISSINSPYFDEIDYSEQNGTAHSSLIKNGNDLDRSSSLLKSSPGFLSSQNFLPDKKLSFSSKQFSHTPRKRKNEEIYLEQQNGAAYSSLIEKRNELNLPSNILKSNAESITSESSLYPHEKLSFNFEHFLYTPRKRKNSNDLSESSINRSQSHLKKTCGIQKGMTSKTVTKQGFQSCNSPLKCQEILPYHSEKNTDLKLWPAVNKNNCYRSYH